MAVGASVGAKVGVGAGDGAGESDGDEESDCEELWDCARKEPGEAESAMGSTVARKTIRFEIIPSLPSIIRARAVIHPQIHPRKTTLDFEVLNGAIPCGSVANALPFLCRRMAIWPILISRDTSSLV